jgi:hypothetical protein
MFRAKAVRRVPVGRSSGSNDFPRKGLRSKRRGFACIFQVVVSLAIRSCLVIVASNTGTDRSRLYLLYYAISCFSDYRSEL